MTQQLSRRSKLVGGSSNGLAQLPAGRSIMVRSADGTRLHTEIFGPEDGYPIVFSHGITCALRVLAQPDRRPGGRPPGDCVRPPRPRKKRSPPSARLQIDHLADDLHAVLEATLRPGERAVIAGHSMGGITISAWSDRYRHAVPHRADAVALINTTTGDLLREIQLIQVPGMLAATRIRIAEQVIRTIGSQKVPRGAKWTSRRFVAAIAVGADAHPAV